MPTLEERAEWLTRACRGTLASLDVRVSCSGKMPESGLIVSNHLSYLDILCFSSIAPCIFVSKAEVRNWPVFGRLATNGGTIYVDRNSKADAHRAMKAMENALRAKIRVVLFPEGTSTGGDRVLPFHAPLLEAAVKAECRVTPACISYQIAGGDPSRDVCYWADMTFASHFLGLLGKGKVHASILIGQSHPQLDNRKTAASVLRNDVVDLHQRLAGSGGPKHEHGVESAKSKRV